MLECRRRAQLLKMVRRVLINVVAPLESLGVLSTHPLGSVLDLVLVLSRLTGAQHSLNLVSPSDGSVSRAAWTGLGVLS